MRKQFLPSTYDSLCEEDPHGFGVLLDALRNEPHKVRAIVTANPALLYVTNLAGENVLHWLVIENRHEEVRLLRSLGSPIPKNALIDAVELGKLETVITLLELGSEVIPSEITQTINYKLPNLNKKKTSLIRQYFKQFGYEV